jgi:hypothetical protein
MQRVAQLRDEMTELDRGRTARPSR